MPDHLQPRWRGIRIQRNVRAAGFEDANDTDNHVQGTFDAQAHRDFRADAEFP